MSGGWSDSATALKMRDSVVRIAKSVINSERPAPFIAEVVFFNVFDNTAQVITAGMADDSSPIQVNFTDPLSPGVARSKDGTTRGNIVQIESRGRALWITQIFSGKYVLAYGNQLMSPTFSGGDFGNIETESNWLVSMGSVPAVGNAQFIGRWDNGGRTLWSGSSFILEIDLMIELFTNQKKTYRYMCAQMERDYIWRTLLPISESGVSNGLDYALEIRIDNTGFELRVRHLRNGIFGTGGYFARIKLIGENYTSDLTSRNLEMTDARPLEAVGRNETNASEVSGTVQMGPYHSGVRHLVETRQHNNLVVPDTMIWNGAALAWTGTWKVVGLGNTEISKLGYISIGMPAVGTSVAVHGSTVIGSIATTAAGFPLSTVGSDASLYYEPQFFQNGDAVATRFHIVTAALSFKIPSHWIFIAAMNPDPVEGNSLLLGNGASHDHWRAVAFQNSWANYATTNAFDACAYRKVGQKVEFRGLAASGTIGATIFTLPIAFRPAFTKIFVVAASFTSTTGASAGTAHTHNMAFGRLDVGNTGAVAPISLASTGYLSMEGLSFEAVN